MPTQEMSASFGPRDILSMVETRLDAIATENADPADTYIQMAKVLKTVRPEFMLSSFSQQRQAEMKDASRDQMATELIEDRAVAWAVQRLTTAPTGADALIVEEQVVRVLLRSLEATQTSERLALKLAEYIKQYSIPKNTVDRIQDELKWATLTPKQRYANLLAVTHFTQMEFKRLLELLREFIKQSNFTDATALGNHYMAVLDAAHLENETEELSRVPELLKAMSAVRTDFWAGAGAKLTEAVGRDIFNHFSHVQLVNALVALCRTIAVYEDFEIIEAAGQAIERSLASDLFVHATCCGEALKSLLPVSAAERVIEIYLENRESVKHLRSASTLLRWAGEEGTGKVFSTLEEEKNTANRLALLRLIARIGSSAVEQARKRLADERWYVVRNSCKLLGDLKDPELLKYVAPLLNHPNERVQKAALSVVLESRQEGKGKAIADSLLSLHGHLIDDALTELSYLKDPESLPGVEVWILGHTTAPPPMLEKAVSVVANIPDVRALKLLAAVLDNQKMAAMVRREALRGLARSKSNQSLRMLADFQKKYEDSKDPLVTECEKLLRPGSSS